MTLTQIVESTLECVRILVEFGILTAMIYCVLYFLRGTRGASVLAGIIIFLIFASLISKHVKFQVLGWLLENFWAVFATAILVIFQPELRRAFAELGSTHFRHRATRQKEVLGEVVSAVMQMSASKTGALIVFERHIGMAAIINSAVVLNAKINSLLLQSLFYPNSPLHDGAVIIKDDTIVAAHAILPLTQEGPGNAARRLGTRHRAALGVTDETDAVVLVVSEETGIISVAYKGRLIRHFTEDELYKLLTTLLISKDTAIPIAFKHEIPMPDGFSKHGFNEEEDSGFSSEGGLEK